MTVTQKPCICVDTNYDGRNYLKFLLLKHSYLSSQGLIYWNKISGNKVNKLLLLLIPKYIIVTKYIGETILNNSLKIAMTF